MSKKKTNKELSAIAQMAVMDDGRIADGSATWSAFGDFKMRWKRSSLCIDFQLSDYLNHADEDILYSLFRTVLNRIFGDEEEHDGVYSDDVLQYVNSQAFRDLKRTTYLTRKRLEIGSGDVHDLNDILDDITMSGETISTDIVPMWSDNADSLVGYSTLFRVVYLPKSLDREEIPEELIRKLLVNGADRITYGTLTMHHRDMASEIPMPELELTPEDVTLTRRYF